MAIQSRVRKASKSVGHRKLNNEGYSETISGEMRECSDGIPKPGRRGKSDFEIPFHETGLSKSECAGRAFLPLSKIVTARVGRRPPKSLQPANVRTWLQGHPC